MADDTSEERSAEGKSRFKLEPVGGKQGAARSADDFLLQELPARARRANPRLKDCLQGKIQISVTNTAKNYLCSWSGSDYKVSEGAAEQADCSIKISEDNLLQVASGGLNPQVAMLSDKIQISGKSGLAVYFFNLFEL